MVADAARRFEAHDRGAIRPDHGVEAVRRLDEAIKRANSLPFGLAAYAFTDLERATRTKLGDGLESGMVTSTTSAWRWPETPFGGVKDSGNGSEGGAETFDGYLTTKFITQMD